MVRHYTYQDIPIGKRRLAANRVREQVRQALTNPFLAEDQKSILHYQLDRITQWEHGSLPVGAPFLAPTRK
jgi:hypothetical protein